MEATEIKKNEECSCLKTHGYKKDTVSAASAVNFMPSGVKALFLSDNEELRAKFSKYYRLYTPDVLTGDKAGEKAGDKVTGKSADAGKSADKSADADKSAGKNAGKTALLCREFKKEFKKLVLPEDLRLVISGDGFNSFGKYAAQEMNKRGAPVKHLLCGGGNLSRFDYIFCGGSAGSAGGAEGGVVFGSAVGGSVNSAGGGSAVGGSVSSAGGAEGGENNGKNATLGFSGGLYRLKKYGASAVFEDFDSLDPPFAFAFVTGTYLALFDWEISSLLFGGSLCGHISSEVQKTVYGLLEAVGSLPKQSARLKKELFSACLATAALVETSGPSLLQGGAYQAAAALGILFKRERRETVDFFEAGFLLSPFVAKAYAAFLEDMPFSFPPDNSRHTAALSEYLGLSEAESVSLPPPYLGLKKTRLADYRLRVYRDGLLRRIYDVIRVLDAAYPMYLKLFEDDGFGLKDFLSPPDISLSLALGSDVLYGDTLLHYMRSKGLLDRYLF